MLLLDAPAWYTLLLSFYGKKDLARQNSTLNLQDRLKGMDQCCSRAKRDRATLETRRQTQKLVTLWSVASEQARRPLGPKATGRDTSTVTLEVSLFSPHQIVNVILSMCL